jgi:hypothetical protein
MVDNPSTATLIEQHRQNKGPVMEAFYNKIKTYPKKSEYNFNILGYLQESNNLNEPSSITFDFPEDKNMTLLRFCENLYYGRRRYFGKAWIDKNILEYSK